jgi:hypothetical protein
LSYITEDTEGEYLAVGRKPGGFDESFGGDEK